VLSNGYPSNNLQLAQASLVADHEIHRRIVALDETGEVKRLVKDEDVDVERVASFSLEFSASSTMNCSNPSMQRSEDFCVIIALKEPYKSQGCFFVLSILNLFRRYNVFF
jgi:hypothetical protein